MIELLGEKGLTPPKFNLDYDLALFNNYIKERHGTFDVVDAANELGLPVEIIESTAMILKNKRIIKTSR